MKSSIILNDLGDDYRLRGGKKVDASGAIMNILLLIVVFYLISRVAHFFKNTKNKLNEIDKKLDEMKEDISNKG